MFENTKILKKIFCQLRHKYAVCTGTYGVRTKKYTVSVSKNSISTNKYAVCTSTYGILMLLVDCKYVVSTL